MKNLFVIFILTCVVNSILAQDSYTLVPGKTLEVTTCNAIINGTHSSILDSRIDIEPTNSSAQVKIEVQQFNNAGTDLSTGGLHFYGWFTTHDNSSSTYTVITKKESGAHYYIQKKEGDSFFVKFNAKGSVRLKVSCIGALSSNEASKVNNENYFYPNPAVDVLYYKGHIGGSYVINDLTGNVIMDGLVLENGTINIESLQKGVYFIKLDNGVVSQFVKE